MIFGNFRPVKERPDRPRPDSNRWLGLFLLFGLAAGGVIGSGWLLAPAHARVEAGSNSTAIDSWIVGGVAMLAFAAVMAKLGADEPKTGGLILHPLSYCGPMVAVVVAVTLWIYYLINLASEATAATLALWDSSIGCVNGKDQVLRYWSGYGVAIALMVAITIMVAVIPKRPFVGLTAVITAAKVLAVIFIAVTLLWYSRHSGITGDESSNCDYPSQDNFWTKFLHSLSNQHGKGLWPTLVSGSVIYSYLGFQGPLDYAEAVRDDGSIKAKARIWLSVLGAVVIAIAIYVLLQLAYNSNYATSSLTYEQIAQSTTDGFLQKTLHSMLEVTAVVAPLGVGLVYAYVLPVEIAALAKEDLTHPFLAKHRDIFSDPVYLYVLITNVVLGVVLILLFGGHWSVLSNVSGVLGLLLYAFPAVVLATQYRIGRDPRSPQTTGRRLWALSARAVIVATAFMLFEAGSGILALSIGLLCVGVALFGYPEPRRIFREFRRQDGRLRDRDRKAVSVALWLACYLAGLLFLAWVHDHGKNLNRYVMDCVVLLWSSVFSHVMIVRSREYQELENCTESVSCVMDVLESSLAGRLVPDELWELVEPLLP
ncbi:APC family permease, partial [Frankia sp. R82]|uniref:APC family permease n=1 Tax=Frankia sp. R82 TaxID=2950553 RepID=UPI0020445256